MTDAPPAPRVRVADTPVVYVDRSGSKLGHLPASSETIFAIHEGRLNQRRWKRYRLSWESFEREMSSPAVSLKLDMHIERHRRLKTAWTGVMAGSIGAAVVSGVLAGALTQLSVDTATTDPTTSTAASVSAPFAGHGIGAGVVMATFAGFARVRVGKKADRPERYYNLLDFLTLDELDAIMEEYERERGTP